MKITKENGAAARDKPLLLVLAGPTAIGKSALGLALAPRLNAEIICADSAQIYRRLDIGTAKPTLREQEAVTHHLIDLVEPDQDFSVADYQKAAYRVIGQLLERGKLPFLIGGTGLYLKAVTDGYTFGARGKSTPLRESLTRQAQCEGLELLYRRLVELDPEAAARIHPRDQRRIIRALEVQTLEGRPISRQVELTREQESPYRLLMFGLTAPRPLLYRRIEERVEAMLKQGFLEEVEALLAQGFTPECPGLQILGYRQLVGYLKGSMKREEAIEEIKRQTRHLAKRQYTWFRREERITWLDLASEAGLDSAAEIISNKLKEILSQQANNMI
ncbi:MAG: tRNA (adenosine(37)-N6)-dimethylallyltransferase MiaA [Bacillota bacterium]